jgi:hypothetical protein
MTALTVGRDPHVESMIRRLAVMDDRGFRQEVDADLRRPGPRERREYEVRRAALRSPELVDRWTTVLLTMTKSVEGQLASKQEDHEAAKADLRQKIATLEQTAPHSDDLFKARQEWEQLKKEYAQSRAQMLRFKTGLDEWVIEARALRDSLRSTMYDSVVAEERNHYAAQVQVLRAAIDAHRTRILEDEDYEPSSADERLWACLR